MKVFRVGAVLVSGALGVFGLAANTFGLFLDDHVGQQPAIPDAPDHFNRSLAPAATVEDFFSRRPDSPDLAWLDKANDVVAQTLAHRPRTLMVQENWILWLGGAAWYPLKDTQDPDKVLASHGGICDDAANVMMDQLKRVGVRSRFVGINTRPGQPLGHVLLETAIAGRWVVSDPDYGIVLPLSMAELRRAGDASEMIDSALQQAGWEDNYYRARYQDIMLKNPVHIHEPGSPLGDKIAVVESAAGIARWPLALGLIAVAVRLARRPHVTPVVANTSISECRRGVDGRGAAIRAVSEP